MANTTIQLKKSATPSASPSVLANGELAINYADGKIFYKNATGQIVSFSAAAGGNYFGTVNANNTLLVSDTTGDILGIYAGNNISISADAVNDTLTIDAVIKVPVQTTAPSSPVNGSLWWNSYLGRLFIYYTDGDSNQWVEANPSGGVANTSGTGSDPAAFNQANTAYNQANAAYDKANSANVLAFNTGIGANNWSNSIAIAANSYANAIGLGSNNYTNAVGSASNSYATLAFNTANLANAQANNISGDTDMKGFLNQTETSLSFNSTSNVFTLGDTGSGWSYWLDGKRYTHSGDSTVIVPGGNPLPNGVYYITIQNNINGTLTASGTVWNLSDPTTIPVSYVKFNNYCTPKYFLAEERHTVLMDSRTHTYLHFTRGTQCHQFGTLTGYSLNGTSNSNNIVSISTTILDDEDIVLTIPSKTAAAGNANNYFVFYRYAANSWAWQQSELPYPFATGGFIQYDSSSALTQAANNVYVNSYLLFTNLDQGAGFAIIPGRGTFANLSSAQSEDAVQFDMTGFGVLESVVAYQFNWKTDSTLTTAGKCQLADAPRKIGTAIASVAPVYTSGLHNDLGGLQGGNFTENYHLTSAEYTALQSNSQAIIANSYTDTAAAAANSWSNTKLSNGTVTLAGALTTTGQIFANSQITISPTTAGAGSEGGQIDLFGAGDYPDWSIDSYQNSMRMFSTNANTMLLTVFNAGAGSVNVGIGKTTAAYPLDVAGITNTSLLIVGPGNTGVNTGQVKLTAGSRLATPEQGVFEFDSTDTVLHFTANTIQGRYLIPATQYFRLTADGSNIGGTIADYFSTNSSIPLVSNGVYEIEIMVYYIKNTAGTVTWTLTNSTTVTAMNAQVIHSPLGGYTSAPTGSTANTAAIYGQTAAASAFGATASLTNNTNHFAIFKILLENGASTSLRLRVTCSAGTVTPKRGSYWKATRITSTNAGTYPA